MYTICLHNVYINIYIYFIIQITTTKIIGVNMSISIMHVGKLTKIDNNIIHDVYKIQGM